jgi:hypothetical protein
MNKSVCITPIDDEMALLADSLQILNEFKNKKHKLTKIRYFLCILERKQTIYS